MSGPRAGLLTYGRRPLAQRFAALPEELLPRGGWFFPEAEVPRGISSARGYADRLELRMLIDGSNKRDLVYQAHAAGTRRVVRFEAPVPKRSVDDVIADADIFRPSFALGQAVSFENEPRQAVRLHGGGAAVVSVVDAATNPVVEAQAGLAVSSADAAALANAIKTLLARSPEECWQMGLRGRRYIASHHDLARRAERFEACLRRAIRGERIETAIEPLSSTSSKG